MRTKTRTTTTTTTRGPRAAGRPTRSPRTAHVQPRSPREAAQPRPVDNRRRRAAAEAAAAKGVLPPRPKRIVALGDGLFSGDFPKKPFARELAMRGPTLIADEYFTSQKCPCGDPLEDMPAAQAALLDPTDASRSSPVSPRVRRAGAVLCNATLFERGDGPRRARLHVHPAMRGRWARRGPFSTSTPLLVRGPGCLAKEETRTQGKMTGSNSYYGVFEFTDTPYVFFRTLVCLFFVAP